MATHVSVSVPRAAPAVRSVLAEHSPDECATFDREFRNALVATEADFDLARVEAVLDRWWGIAHLRANPPVEQERAVLARAAGGDFTGLYAREDDGTWSQL